MAEPMADLLREVRKCNRLLAAILKAVSDDEAPALCPLCGETDADRIEDSSVMGQRRLTCLSCSRSFAPEEVTGG